MHQRQKKLCFNNTTGIQNTLPHQFLHRIQNGKYSQETDLEVYDNSKDNNRGQKVHQVWEVLAIECLTKSSDFVLPRRKKMKQCNNGAFKFRPY